MQQGTAIAVGTKVSRGQTIGKVGSSGQSSGPHCHFDIWVNGERINNNPGNVTYEYSSYHDPIGCVDSATASEGKITVTGWAFDQDVPTTAIGVHVYVGGPAGSSGAEGHAITANKSRPDVAKAYSSLNIGNNHGFSDTFTTSKSGTQTLYFYAINAGGGTNNPQIGTKTVTIPKDSTKPVISNVQVTNITSSGYTVTCNVSDNVAIKEVKFPTWTANSAAASDQDDLKWHVGKVSGNTASFTVKTSEHNNEKDIFYVTHIYAYDTAGNVTTHGLSGIFIDGTAPVISNVKVTNVSTEGFDITCKVTDRSTITKVQFPTCTDYDSRGSGYNGQDDLGDDWPNNGTYKGTVNGSTVTYHASTKDHNNETGLYHVHIYAWDSFGNRTDAYHNMIYISRNGEEGYNPVATKQWNGHTYKLIEGEGWDGQKPQWSEASAYCQSIGGHLATVSSAEENQIITGLVSAAGQNCWIGATDEEKEGTFVWATGEPFSYTNWKSGDPNNTSGDVPPMPENYVSMEIDGTWTDYATKRYKPFICEIDTADNDITTMDITLQEDDFTYDGEEKTPSVMVKKNGKTLTAGADYRVVYSDNVKAGTAKVTVVGTGSYIGTVEKTFTINKAPGEITASVENPLTVGDQKDIQVNTYGTVHYVSDDTETAAVDTNGRVTAKKAGTVHITVESSGDGNHDAASCILTVEVREKTKDISACSIQLEQTEYVYDGEEKCPGVTIKDGTEELVLNEDYYVSYEDNINAGTAKMAVEGISGYLGSVERTFTIRKADQIHLTYLDTDNVKVGESTAVNAYGTGEITYTSSDESIAKVDAAGKVSALKEGTARITVTFAGNQNYNGAADVVEITVEPVGGQGGDHTHSYKYTVTKAATCEEEGTGTFTCEECGDSYTQKIPATGHSWNSGVETKAPTCTAEGVRTYTCTVCGKNRTEATDALGHEEVTDAAVEPTCVSAGYTEGSHCARCGAVIKKQEEIPMLEHHWGEAMMVTKGNCAEHGKEIQICEDCGQARITETPVGDHSYGDPMVVKEATCTEKGLQILICSICEKSRTEEIPAKGHTPVTDPAVEPTTTTTGLTEGSHCSVCGAVIKAQEVIPKKAEEGQGEDVTPATPSDPDHPAVEEKEKEITAQAGDGDPKGSTYGTLSARVKKSAKTSNTLGWNKVSGANGYIVYGNRCGEAYHFEKLAEVRGTSYKHSGLKKGTYYKYLVVAYKEVSGERTVLATSKAMHAATTGGKVGNCKKLKLNKTKITLKVKKTFKIKAKEVAASKKLKIKRHRKIAFESSNPKIATVTASGKIKAVKKGSCKIYVYAQNGVYKVVKVKVK